MSVQHISTAFTIQGLTASEKLVLICLANYAGADGTCWPSQKTIGEDTSLSERTIWGALKSLQEKGLITRSKRTRPDGYRAADLFTITFDLPATIASKKSEVRKICEESSQNLRENLAPVATQEPLENHQEPPLLDKTRAPDQFDVFWSAYPEKVGKPVARAAFAKALKRIDHPEPLAVILAGIQRATESRKWREGVIPNPSTWLNQDRWEDQPNNTERGKNWRELEAENNTASYRGAAMALEIMKEKDRRNDRSGQDGIIDGACAALPQIEPHGSGTSALVVRLSDRLTGTLGRGG